MEKVKWSYEYRVVDGPSRVLIRLCPVHNL